MKIGGLVPFSLSDYPGRVAAVVFAQGCNFRCPFCHNGQLIPANVTDNNLLTEEAVWRLLDSRRGGLQGVVVSGGEPTLQATLPEFLHRIRVMGYAIKLDTNGSRPAVIRELLIDDLVDFVAMDIKAPLADYSRLAGVTVDVKAIRESIELIAQSGVQHEFRTTVVRALLSENDQRRIVEMVPRGSAHRFQPFRTENALAPWLRQ